MLSYRQAMMGGVAVCAVLAATPAAAQVQSFDIPAQPARTAIPEFGRQSGIQILAARADVGDQQVAAIKGEYEPREALRLLLAQTDLRIASDDGRTVTLTQAPQSGSAAGTGAEVEALIVTAQKREEDIQDVPIAISAFTQEDLTRSQIAGGPDLITQVPNMTFTKTNFSSYSVQLRGIGTQAISATTDPAVAVAFNNTPFIRNRFFEQEFYDLQRVEVLRGPQGTLYGRNATAGVVNIISQKPKFVFEAKASADVSNYSASRLEGMVNVPLVEDVAALRIAGAWTKRDGYATNELTGNPIDGRDLWSTRVSLRVSPNDRFDMNLIWEHFEEDDDRLRSGKQLCKKDVVTQVGDLVIDDYFTPVPDRGQRAGISTVQSAFSQGCERESLYSPAVFQTPNGQSIPYYFQLAAIGLPIGLDDPYVSEVQSPDLRMIESTIDPEYRASADIGELQASFDLTDNLTLSSETAYGTDSVYSLQDFNRFNTAPGAWSTIGPNGVAALARGVLTQGPSGGVFCDPQLGCSDRLVAVDISTAKARQFSQEVRLASDFEGKFNFSLGANYLRADSEDKYYVFINSLSLIAAIRGVVSNYDGGETDNVDCLESGYKPGDPDDVYRVTGCIYLDPNPIGRVNDLGHNYFLSKNPYKLISYAVFGESYYNITDNLKVTAGLRWTVDKKEAPRIPTWILASQSVGYPVAEVIEQEWREPTGRLTVDWKPDLAFTDETLIYGSFAHGYKAGGANPPGFVRVFYSNSEVAEANSTGSATRPRTFEPEFIDAFEIGSKNTMGDGRVTLNLAAFYYDYKDYQISEIVDRSAFNRNFDATVWGVELEADWRPLENLRLGLKGGYQDSRIADGEKAVDLMDRTAGNEDWIVVRPFPTYASNCILPVALYLPPGGAAGFGPLLGLGAVNGGGPGGCEYAYAFGYDPGTELPYGESGGPGAGRFWQPGTYPGFDPATAPNNGEGFDKPLGGNALPNAPNWTLTGTVDYTIALPNAWLATLHTDLHWQSESYWRIFQDHEFSTLDEYFTMNLAAIFTNEERGWNVMAYVKNVTDETAISGAFLNSDDTGLTTNVFLTEPRLYGLRVTKTWSGGPLLGSFGERRPGPPLFTLEIGGQAARLDAPNAALDATHASAFTGPLDILDAPQEEDLDWGDGRHVKLTYRPDGGPWMISLGVRTEETNALNKAAAEVKTEPVCVLGGPFVAFCNIPPEQVPAPFTSKSYFSKTNRADASVQDREDYKIVEASVQREVGFGSLGRSAFGLSLRHAQMNSTTAVDLLGVPDWNVPVGLYPALRATSTIYDVHVGAERSFEGVGPVLSWDAGASLLDWGEAGLLGIDWAVGAGVLFGQQDTSIAETAKSTYVSSSANWTVFGGGARPTTTVTEYPAVTMQRSSDATVPTVNAALGLSYTIGGFTAGVGYRWERYFDVLDVGYDEERSADRTIDGPYFKLAIGFGG